MGYSESENECSTITTNNEESDQNLLEEDSDEIVMLENNRKSFLKAIKAYCRLVKKNIALRRKKRLQNNFTNILYFTTDCPEYTPNSSRIESPTEYIVEMRKQYPENDIRIIVPIIGLDKETFQLSNGFLVNIGNKTYKLEKTSIEFDFYIQNHVEKATLYKYEQNDEHIDVYGIFCAAFSFCNNPLELIQLQYLAPITKALRSCVKKFKNNKKEQFEPNIVHCENIPFYLGSEFENNLFNNINVVQTIKDFTQIEMLKIEPFWAAINLADKFSMTMKTQQTKMNYNKMMTSSFIMTMQFNVD